MGSGSSPCAKSCIPTNMSILGTYTVANMYVYTYSICFHMYECKYIYIYISILCMYIYVGVHHDVQDFSRCWIDKTLGQNLASPPSWPTPGVLLQRPYHPHITGSKAFLNAQGQVLNPTQPSGLASYVPLNLRKTIYTVPSTKRI